MCGWKVVQSNTGSRSFMLHDEESNFLYYICSRAFIISHCLELSHLRPLDSLVVIATKAGRKLVFNLSDHIFKSLLQHQTYHTSVFCILEMGKVMLALIRTSCS